MEQMPIPEQLKKIQDENMSEEQVSQSEIREESYLAGVNEGKNQTWRDVAEKKSRENISTFDFKDGLLKSMLETSKKKDLAAFKKTETEYDSYGTDSKKTVLEGFLAGKSVWITRNQIGSFKNEYSISIDHEDGDKLEIKKHEIENLFFKIVYAIEGK